MKPMYRLADFLFNKAFNPDEVRGEHGRWVGAPHSAGSREIDAPFRMSEQEKTVLEHVRSGKSTKEISRLLGISKESVNTHRVHATEKDRLRILTQNEKSRSGAKTTLRQAHNANPTLIDPRRGRWK